MLRKQLLLTIALTTFAAYPIPANADTPQLTIPRIQAMPNTPDPYEMRDWAQVARDYDTFVFDFGKHGRYLPLIWWDQTEADYDFRGFGIPHYVGSNYQKSGPHHEAINCIAAVVGASLVGIDKSDQDGHNFVRMCQRYFSKDRGIGLYLNGVNATTGGSFWYESYPALLFGQLLSLYPNTGQMSEHMIISADRMCEAIIALKDERGIPDFNHTAFNYEAMEPVDHSGRTEPEAAAAYAWFQYMACVQTGNPRYLRAADLCMRFLLTADYNPFYEVLLPHAAYLAARMNAERGKTYDVQKLLEYSFGPTRVIRPGWGVIVDRWDGIDVSGLTGSTTDGGGYAFAMNTYDQIAALAPLARYDDRYARAIGKYVLNAANAARFFFPNAHPPQRQNSAQWAFQYDPHSCIGYEGCRKRGRRCVVPDADFRTAHGHIAAGDWRRLTVLHEADGDRCESLVETVVGDHDALSHIWSMRLPPAVSRWLVFEGRCQDAGDADNGFRVSYAVNPEGPYTGLFDVTPGDTQSKARPLPCDFDGRIYIKAEDTDRTAGQVSPDMLLVDCIYIRYEFEADGPFGMGDIIGGSPLDIATDLGLYGSSHVGYLGGLVQQTNVEKILQIDLLKTDWFHAPAYPTYLYFNPHKASKTVRIDVGNARRDIYETVTETFIARGVAGAVRFPVPGDAARVIVLCPAGGQFTRRGNRTMVDDVVVDYSYPKDHRSARRRRTPLGRVPIAPCSGGGRPRSYRLLLPHHRRPGHLRG